MSLFRRKNKSDDDEAAVAAADTAEAPAVGASDPDPSNWAIPPDAPAPSGAPVDDTPPPELMAAPTGEPLDDTPPPELAPVGEPLDETPPPELAAPVAADAATVAAMDSAPKPEPPRRPLPAPEPARNLPASSTFGDLARDRPELIVVGAFVGAFVVARILKRIGSD